MSSSSKFHSRERQMPCRSSFRSIAVAMAGIMVVTACTDQSPTGLSPKQVPGLRRSLSEGGDGRPTLFSNSVKYRDQGKKAATGRSGSSSLTARALLGKDGATTLDITTGELDAATAPGLLKKIQLKQFDPNGNLQTTSNWKDIGAPTTRMVLPGRVRGSNLQLQGNVVGVDPTRTDVVTITESVKLRPDLGVTDVQAPARALVGTAVTISAIVTENNGDVGARSDCLLLVDGSEVDRSNGIWVDAGRSVSCVFIHTFTTIGAKQIDVRAAAVVPGDYDGANNDASSSIEIVSPPSTNDFTWSASVRGTSDLNFRSTYNGYYYYSDRPDRNEWSYETNYTRQNSRQTAVDGYAQSSVGGLLFLTFVDRMDGALQSEITFDPSRDYSDPFSEDFIDGAGRTGHVDGSCARVWRTEPHVVNGQAYEFLVGTLQACTAAYSGAAAQPGWDFTTFNAYTEGNDASYFSSSYSHQILNGVENTYALNVTYTYAFGEPLIGSEYSFAVEVGGPNGTKRASGSIPITATHVVIPWSEWCPEGWYGNFFQHYCQGDGGSYTAYYGFAFGTPE